MTSEQKLKEVIELGKKRITFLKSQQNITDKLPYAKSSSDETLKIIVPLITLAQSHLEASKELPLRNVAGHSDNCKGTTSRDCTCGAAGVNDIWNDCLDQVTPIVARLREENEELKRKTNFTYCAYCGKEYPLDTDGSLISEHIKTCDKHPLVQRIATLEDALKRAEGKIPSVKEITKPIIDVIAKRVKDVRLSTETTFHGNCKEIIKDLAQAIHALPTTRGEK